MRRFAIACLTFSILFILGLSGLLLFRQPTEPTLNTQFREINELKADFDRLGMDLNRISRGAKTTMGATSDEATTEETPGETPEQAQPETQESEEQEDRTGD